MQISPLSPKVTCKLNVYGAGIGLWIVIKSSLKTFVYKCLFKYLLKWGKERVEDYISVTIIAGREGPFRDIYYICPQSFTITFSYLLV